ncbi:MAG TPA: class I SAM-dependent methyltransferase [Patescibacteria group bacterium]
MIVSYVSKGSVMCDLGCGKEGGLLKIFKDRISLGIGVDMDVDSVKDEKIELKKGDLNDVLPIDDSFCDLVVSLAVLEHLEKPHMLIREARRILCDGGFLIISTPTPTARFVLEFISKLHLISREEIEDHKHYFSAAELIEMAKESGFKSIELIKFQAGFNQLLIAKK